MMRLLSLLFIFLLRHGGPFDGCASASEPQSAADIRQRLSETQSLIQSFHAVFEITSEPDEARPLGDILHREVGALTPAYVLHLNAHGNRKVPWSDDLRCQRALVTQTDVTVDWMRHRAFSRWNWDYTTESSLPGSLPQETFFKSTGLWPLDSRLAIRTRTGVPYALRLIAQDDSYSMGDPAVEVWGDRACHILLRKGFDKLWLDPHKGWSLVIRELYAEQTDKCVERFELSDHVEVAPTIWLPKRIRHLRFDSDRSTDERSSILTDYVCDVLSWKINEMTPESFTLANRPGELWLNPPDGVPRQVEEGGEEYLDEVTAWADRNGFSQSNIDGSTIWLDKISIVFLGISGVLIALARGKVS
ncbi:MAG: hypothetical protein AABP62_18930 [Planctomycetota bacterium]